MVVKKNEEKKPPKMERLLLERILQSQAYQYQLVFFLFKKYFCFSKRKLDLDKYFFKSLFSSLLYDKKNICLGMSNFISTMVYMYL